jgi:hypothetical protein
VIPKNFGLEFAPWKMASKKWTLADYNEKKGKRFLYNSSFSLGTVSDSTVYSSKISIGYRFSLLSESADLVRMAYSKKTDFAQKALEATTLKTEWETYWVTQVVSPRPSAAEMPEYADHHPKEFTAWLAAVDPAAKDQPAELMILVYKTKRVFGDDFSFVQFKTLSFSDVETALLDKMIATYKNTNWNASRFDGALAWVGESKDSLATNARFSSFNAWATYAQKMGAKGQLLLGGNLKMPNAAVDTAQHSSPLQFSLSARLLLGNTAFRFFGETQWQSCNYGTVKNAVLLNLGGEIKISDKFWLIASSGVDNVKDRTSGEWYNRIVANLDLRYGLNL